ncbi:Aste57867_22854 [Aphanomyces stellatus]|uniref:Aste57867_22854 protein n=1 Tax=Aphanomyces stellatus TaxID=120398 RepID=A0A485LLA5_9STRA|nr:hypothetical protein As57867_022783 [Aphanomyces stellatus]VFT99504.1 Aste57867_22854 [Aphanomyces stellatus]
MLDHTMGDLWCILLTATSHIEQLFLIVLPRSIAPAIPVDTLLNLATLYKQLVEAIPNGMAQPKLAIMTENAIMDQVYTCGQSHLSKDPSEWTELDSAANSVLATKDLFSWINIVAFTHFLSRMRRVTCPNVWATSNPNKSSAIAWIYCKDSGLVYRGFGPRI